MNQKEAIEKLKKEASINPVMNAVLHVFAMRKRARSKVTLDVLAKSMRSEGFLFGKEQYQAVLESLANAGFGHLQKDAKGRIRALEKISVTFKSLGTAVCGSEGCDVKTFRPRTRFSKLPKPAERT